MEGTIAGNLIAAGIGLVFGVLFEDPLTRLRDKFIHKYKRLFYKNPSQIRTSETFSFGPLQTSWLIVDGDGKEEYSEESIDTHFENKKVSLPDDLESLRKTITQEQNDQKKKGDHYFWNGDMYALDRISVEREDKEKSLGLEMWFRFSDYYTFLATQKAVNEKVLFEKYFSEQDQFSPHKYFASSFGINLAVITLDDYLLVPKRSSIVGAYKNLYSASVNETLDRGLDRSANGLAPDLYRCAVRGIAEELGYTQSQSRMIDFLSIGVDTKLSQWGMLGMTKIQKTAEDVLVWRSRGVKDRWEYSQMEIVKFTIKDVILFVHDHSDWTPAGLACIYHMLVHEFSKEKVEKEIQKVFKK